MAIKNIYKSFINRYLFYSISSFILYINKEQIIIDYKLDNNYTLIIFISLILITLYFWIKWINRWFFEYDIRNNWFKTIWTVLEEKHIGQVNYNKYSIKFIDNNEKEIIFEEKHSGIYLSDWWSLNKFKKILWLIENIYPKVEVMYNKDNSENAIIY
jgi:hypothetical protein